MKPLVVDASVAVKWFLPEEDSAMAVGLLDGRHRLLAPDLLWIELAAAAWKIARRGGLSPAEAEQIVCDAAAYPVESMESRPLLPIATRLATQLDRIVYDCLYLALAERETARVVTADERFVNSLRQTQWSQRVLLLRDSAQTRR